MMDPELAAEIAADAAPQSATFMRAIEPALDRMDVPRDERLALQADLAAGIARGQSVD